MKTLADVKQFREAPAGEWRHPPLLLLSLWLVAAPCIMRGEVATELTDAGLLALARERNHVLIPEPVTDVAGCVLTLGRRADRVAGQEDILRPVQRDGVDAWELAAGRAPRFVHLDVTDPGVSDGACPSVDVNFLYRDTGNVAFELQVDTVTGPFTAAGYVATGNSGAWRLARFRIPDAQFSNRQHGRGDLRFRVTYTAAAVFQGVYVRPTDGVLEFPEVPDRALPVLQPVTDTMPHAATAAGAPRLCLWLSAADLLSGGAGAPVSRWPDRSGSGHDAVQHEAACRPVLDATAGNGRPGVRFSGQRCFLALPGVRIPAEMTLILVCEDSPQTRGGSGFRPLLHPDNDGFRYDSDGYALSRSRSDPSAFGDVGGTSLILADGGVTEGSGRVDAWHKPSGRLEVITCRRWGHRLELRRNGVMLADGESHRPLTALYHTGYWLGGSPGESRNYRGVICDVRMYDSALDDARLAATEKELLTTYGIAPEPVRENDRATGAMPSWCITSRTLRRRAWRPGRTAPGSVCSRADLAANTPSTATST